MKMKNALFYISIFFIFTGFFGNFIAEAKEKNIQKPIKKEECTLSIEAGVVMRNGEARPISRSKFYLLDKNLYKILIEGNFTDTDGKVLTKRDSVYITYIFSIRGGVFDQYRESNKKANLLIESHIVQSVTTDFGGKAAFEKVPPGIYYIMGFSELGSNELLWDEEVKLSPGNNSLILDQNNTAYFYNR
ncbi:MAG: hypothetical protein JZU65_15830 [Chlorobium sp.]|nr:hypothetical protein [Chlorobium sp.]